MKYIPKPMNTEDTKLPAELEELMESLAENVHENWAAARVEQGWRYGEERSDKDKTTPCLVPYDELPELEKDYDRRTAAETLKFIIANGYKIVKE